jgi:hypothetical protein
MLEHPDGGVHEIRVSGRDGDDEEHVATMPSWGFVRK